MAKLGSLLLDTGLAAAFLDRADPEHRWDTRELSAAVAADLLELGKAPRA